MSSTPADTPSLPDAALPVPTAETGTPSPDAPDRAGPAVEPVEAPATDRPASPTEVAEALRTRFPALFRGPAKPVKLRIQVDIQARAPGVFSRQALSGFFRRHTLAFGYLQAVSRGGSRYDLDGQPAGEISDEHRQAALEELNRRRTMHQQRQADEAAARQGRAALLRDFERTTLTRANFCALKRIEPEALDALLEQARREAAEAPPAPRPGADRGPRPPRGQDRPNRPDGRRPEARGGGRGGPERGERRAAAGRSDKPGPR